MARRTIDLGEFVHDEKLANAALSPGHLLERLSTDKVQKHSTEGGYWNYTVAKEQALGPTAGDLSKAGSVDDAYAANELVPIKVAQPNSRLALLLKAGVNYAIGDKLISDGAGRVKKLTAVSSGVTVKQVVGECLEAVALSASGSVDTLGMVQIY